MNQIITKATRTDEMTQITNILIAQQRALTDTTRAIDGDYYAIDGAKPEAWKVYHAHDAAGEALGNAMKTLKEATAAMRLAAQEVRKTELATRNFENGPRWISIDNGRTFITPEEAIAEMPWAVIAHAMKDDTREMTHDEMAPCSDLEFLIRYLELAEEDLIIG